MRLSKIFLAVVLLFTMVSTGLALKGVLATPENIATLKQDILDGKIVAGKTRLKEVQEKYGEPAMINETNKGTTYEYGKLKIEFEKKQYMRKWEYDYSHKPQYSDDIKKLRKDLAADKIAGDFIEIDEKIRKDYEEPTEAFEKFGDGELSIYYYGELKLTFENVITVKKWKGEDLDKIEDKALTSSSVLKEEKKEEKK
jgi:hypothetical protein